MTHKSTIALFVLLLAALSPAAEPAFRVGPRLTYGLPYAVYGGPDDSAAGGMSVIAQQPYVATGFEVEYGPVFMFRVGLEMAQVRLFTHGGADVVAFPLGANVTIEPPVNWRLLPYAFVGGHFGTDFMGRTTLGDSLTMIAPLERSVRAGIGGRFAITPRIDVYTEIQLYSFDSHNDYSGSIFGQEGIEVIGVDHIHLGARFRLGR